MFICPLDQVSLAGVASAGRKAAAAGELLRAGFPVPPGICLTADAFAKALAPVWSDVEVALARHETVHPAGRPAVESALDGALSRLAVPEDLLEELWHAVAPLRSHGTGLAVRSSAADEDGWDGSRAGAYATVLGVRDRSALREAVLACWRSYFSPAALAMRAGSRNPGDGFMGVLIQPVVEAECAGVCYSLDPVSPGSRCAVISAAWGLGAGVVDGTIPADTLRVNRDSQEVIERRIAEKPQRVVLGPQSALASEPVEEERRRAACLPDAWAARIAQFALAAEALFGSPQDVEFAIAGNQVWILQSRPIASLPAALKQCAFPVTWENDDERRRPWYRSHPSGREQDVLLPLEIDERLAEEGMREDTCRLMGADMNGRFKVANGRLYVAIAPAPFAPGDGRIRRQAWQDLEERLAEQGLTVWDFWGPEIVKATQRLAAFDPRAAGGPALAVYLEDALAEERRGYMFHPLSSKHPPGEAFVRIVGEVTGFEGPAARTLAEQLAGSERSIVARILDEIYDLALLAAPDPALSAFVANPIRDPSRSFVDEFSGGASVGAFWARLRAIPGSAEFADRLERLLAAYGDRNGAGWGSEATVCTPTWRERPEDVLRLAAGFLAAGVTPPAEARRRAAAGREARIEAICASLSPESAARFRRLHRRACRLAEHLEEHNHYIDQLGCGQTRRAVLVAADWLVRVGALAARDDVFWLRFDEILAALRAPRQGDQAPGPETEPGLLHALVSARRAEYEAWRALSAPPLLGVPDAALPPRPPLLDEAQPGEELPARTLAGQPASAGQARGRARIALDPTSLPDLRAGDVLIAPNAGPRWTLHLPLLAGLVLEGGSVGQHPAAVAREFGIPAVVGVRAATLRIPDGAQVLVDGTAGTVEIID